MTPDRIGFIGTGNLGVGMATRLLEARKSLTVCDTNLAAVAPLRERGAHVASTPHEVADRSEIVFACLPSQEVSREVALGVEGIYKGKAIKVYVELSTIGRTCIKAIADGLEPAHIGLLDAPVSGGTARSREGRLSMIVSGSRENIEHARPHLETIARKITVIGDKPGMAQIAKLVNNNLSKIGKVAAYESIVMGVKAGLDAKTLLDFINASGGRNYTTMERIPEEILNRRFKEKGTLHISFKDAQLVLDEAKALGAPLWLAKHVMELYEEAAAHGYMERSTSVMIQYIEKLAGVEVRGPDATETYPVKK